MPFLSRPSYFKIAENYVPLSFEILGDETGLTFKRPMNYALRTRFRYFLVFQYIREHFKLLDSTLLDLGPYPGTFLRLIRDVVSSGNLKLYGAGLNASDGFVSSMKDTCGATILEANLDPINPDLESREFPSTIPLDDRSIDYIHAGEIIEHLTNPNWIFQESYRVLRRGGGMIITTPNVTRAGNVFKLLVGRSNFDRLSPLGSQESSDEWRRHFHEYEMRELVDLVEGHGFDIVCTRHFNNRITELVIKSWRQRGIDALKIPFYLVPHFKDSLFVVAIKP